jgi:serine/threonine protein kinase
MAQIDLLLTKYCIKSNLLKRYTMIGAIGKGGFATVYNMEKKDTNELYAVKLIKKNSIKSSKEVRYLKHEIRVLRKLNHDCCVRTYEVHELD